MTSLALESWQEIPAKVVITDGTEEALQKLREFEGREESQKVSDYRELVAKKSQEIIDKHNLPDKGETKFWRNDELADKKVLNLDNPTFSFLTWNIQWGKNLEKQVDYLREISPDVLCLQEVDWNCKRSNNRNVALEMARKLGYKFIVYTTEFVEVDGDKTEFPDSLRGTRKGEIMGISEGGGVHGQAILSRYPITDIGCIKLHKLFHDWENGSTIDARREPRTGQRICQKVKIQIGNKNVAIYNVHLEDKQGGETGRLAQYDQIANDAEKEDLPIIVGDLNTVSHGLGKAPIIKSGNLGDLFVNAIIGPFERASKIWERAEFSDGAIKRQLEDGIPEDRLRGKVFSDPDTSSFTFRLPLGSYKGKLDWTLFEKDNFMVKRHEPGPWGLSDHRPLFVELTVLED